MVPSKAAWSSASLSVVVTGPPCPEIDHLLTYRSVNTASGQPVAQAARLWPLWPHGDRALHLPPRRVRDPDAVVQRRRPTCPPPPPPPLHPGTREPVGPDDLAPLFPMALIEQEVTGGAATSTSPAACSTSTGCGGRRPLVRARRLEKLLDTPAKIFYKYEGVSPAGSHKPNTAVPQALLQPPGGHHPADHRDRRRAVGHRAGLRDARSTAWSARSGRSRSSYRPEAVPAHDDGDLRRDAALEPVGPHRGRSLDPGRRTPTPPARLGIAISEAVEAALQREPDTRYALGSRAQPRPAAPDRHRRGGAAPAGAGRGGAGRARRLHRWRVELRRPGVPVPAREAGRPDEPGDPLRRAGGLPDA